MGTLPFDVARQIERRATAASMPVADFVAGAVREFLENAADDQWFQLLTIIRKSNDPGLSAVQTILTWAVTERVGREKSSKPLSGNRFSGRESI